jgi:hypothetical protein
MTQALSKRSIGLQRYLGKNWKSVWLEYYFLKCAIEMRLCSQDRSKCQLMVFNGT